jgi:hypothetical protein
MEKKVFYLTQREADLLVEAMVHWEEVMDPINCPICMAMKDEDCEREHCNICPVYRYTRLRHCIHTPMTADHLTTPVQVQRVLALGNEILDAGGYYVAEIPVRKKRKGK